MKAYLHDLEKVKQSIFRLRCYAVYKLRRIKFSSYFKLFIGSLEINLAQFSLLVVYRLLLARGYSTDFTLFSGR